MEKRVLTIQEIREKLRAAQRRQSGAIEESGSASDPRNGDPMGTDDTESLIVRLVFDDDDRSDPATTSAQDVASGLSALATALAGLDEDALVEASLTDKVAPRAMEDMRKLVAASYPWRIDLHGSERGSLVLLATVHSVKWLWGVFDANRKLRDAIVSVLGETEPAKELKEHAVHVLDRGWSGFKHALGRALVRVGFHPKLESRNDGKVIEAHLEQRSIDDVKRGRCLCCHFEPTP